MKINSFYETDIEIFPIFDALLFVAESASAQFSTFKELHKVKRKETIFGIARDNGLTVQELINANPEMNMPGYELKKGDYIKIPYPNGQQPKAEPNATVEIDMPTKPKVVEPDMRQGKSV